MGTWRQYNQPSVWFRVSRRVLGFHICVPDTPSEAATLLEIVGVVFVIGIGFPSDFDVAFDLGTGHPVEFEHFALSIGQTDGDVKIPTVSLRGEISSFSPAGGFVGVSSFGPAPELVED